MKYIYGLYDQRYPNRLRYIGQTDNPPRRLRDHWNSRHSGRPSSREWEHRLTEWLGTLDDIPFMKILLPCDNDDVNRAEHDAIVEAQGRYGTGQIINDNTGVSNSIWFDKLIHGPDIRVNIETQASISPGNEDQPRESRSARKRARSQTKNMEIAAWWVAQGGQLGHNGRIPIDGLRAYRTAHGDVDGEENLSFRDSRDREIREWCVANGYPLGYKNRVLTPGLNAYREAHPSLNGDQVQ